MGWPLAVGMVASSVVGGLMSKKGSSSTAKSTATIANWDTFPDLAAFWDEYVDLFWGTPSSRTVALQNEITELEIELKYMSSDDAYEEVAKRTKENELKELEKRLEEDRGLGTGSYRDMIEADREWITNAYIQQDTTLTQLENKHKSEMAAYEKQYIEDVEGGAEQFEHGMKDSSVNMLSPGGRMIGMTPRSTQRTLEAMRDNRNTIAESRLGAGRSQAGRELVAGENQAQRDLEIAQATAPHATDLAYLEYLRKLGMTGQHMRAGIQQKETVTKESGDTLSGALAGANMGMSAYSAYNA